MKRAALACALCALLVAPATAQNVTGNELLNLCSGSAAERAVAAGYVVGASDTMVVAQDAGWVDKKMCLRAGATAEQMTDVVCQYLTATPAFRDFSGTVLVSLALNGAFPCQ